jgi:tetratricopeptide (TPR) repeat protein
LDEEQLERRKAAIPRILQAANLAGPALLAGAALLGVAAITQDAAAAGSFAGAIGAIGGTAGVEALGIILDRWTQGQEAPAAEIRAEIDRLLAVREYAEWQQQAQYQQDLALLFQHIGLVRHAVAEGNLSLVEQMAGAAADHRALLESMIGEIAAIRVEQAAGRERDEAFQGRFDRLEELLLHSLARPDPDLPGRSRLRFEYLPLHEVPPRGPKPPGSTPLLPHNFYFTGREAELMQIAAAIKGGDGLLIHQAATITGLGGLGKTQLAVEFAKRYGRFFLGGVFWLNLGQPDAFHSQITECGLAMNLPGFGSKEPAEQEAAVRQAWLAPVHRLVIFDNCDSPEAIALMVRWLPENSSTRMLVTSRSGALPGYLALARLPLKVMPRDQSIELLRRHRPQLDAALLRRLGWTPEETDEARREAAGLLVEHPDSLADQIAAELGDLPLALHLAGSYLAHYGEAPGRYLDRLIKARIDDELLEGHWLDDSPTDHDWCVHRTLKVSFDRLEPDNRPADAAALELLARLACLVPGEAVPWMVVGWADEDDDARHRLADGRERLLALGLAEESRPDEGTPAAAAAERWLTCHRLILAFVRDILSADQLAAAQTAVERAALAEAHRLNRTGDPRPVLAWQSHLRHLTATALERGNETAAALANNLGYHLGQAGDPAAAWPYYERALAILERVLGPDHPATALSLNNLGSLLQAMGDPAAARPCYERALAIWERVLGPDHPNTATSLNNLGALLRAMGDPAAARPYYERALTILEKVLGPNHPHTRIVRDNLAALED